MRELRDYQVSSIALARAAMAMHRRVMIQAPTGAGKTLMAAAVIASARAKAKRVVFVVPRLSLINQTYLAFVAEGITDIGVIQADHPWTKPEAPVQIASVQTLAHRKFPETDFVIVDEAHEAYKVIFRWMAERPDLRFVGLSATPWTRGLAKHWDHLVIAATAKDLIAQGVLVPYRAYGPDHPDLSGVKTVAGDYDEAGAAEVMSKPKLTADIVRNYCEHGENRPTLCFAVNRAHARQLQDEFEKAGITNAYLDGNSEIDERQHVGNEFNAGRIKVVVNVGVLTTGVDWDVRCIILARPTKSEILFVQIIGRGLRAAPGKTDCLIFDHSDTILNLGFPDDIHHDKLDDGKPKKASTSKRESRPSTPKECTSCHFLKPAGVHKCPACGFAPAKREDIEVIDGDLVQLSGGKLKADHATKQAFWSGLLWYCDHQGKTEKWALATYRNKFGVWPRGLEAVPRPPDAQCRNFIKASMIRWIKGKERHEREVGHARA